MSDKAVVLVGGSGPLGRRLREQLNASGRATVNIDLRHDGGDYADPLDLCFYGVDACREASLTEVRDALASQGLEFDGLVSLVAFNPPPGIGIGSYDLAKFDVDQWETELRANVTSAAITCKVFGGVMVRQGYGSIVLVASDLGVIAPDQRIYKSLGAGVFKSPAYTVGKHAIVGLAKHAATFWAASGVRCNAISPGPIGPLDSPALEQELTARIPLGRLAKVEEVASCIQFLLSSEASFITGANYSVDGGRSTW